MLSVGQMHSFVNGYLCIIIIFYWVLKTLRNKWSAHYKYTNINIFIPMALYTGLLNENKRFFRTKVGHEIRII